MRNLLFITGLLLGILLFVPGTGTNNKNVGEYTIFHLTSSLEEKEATDTQHHFEALSNELKNSQCLTPRRVIQPASNILNLRIGKTIKKSIQDLRLQGEKQLHRVSQHRSNYLTVKVSALFCRMGEQIFSLRKLLI